MPPLARVSFAPSIISSPGGAVGLETLCEARTRVVSPLGGSAIFGPLEPQEARVKQAATSRVGKNAALFKQQAPKDKKNLDLGAKKRIIADLEFSIIWALGIFPLHDLVSLDAQLPSILYSEQVYGG